MLEWVSDLVVEDIFDEGYPGRDTTGVQPRQQLYCPHPNPAPTSMPANTPSPPQSIIRHHRAPWATAEQRRSWRAEAAGELRRLGASGCVSWQLDGEMLGARGWAGHTCRHPRQQGVPLGALDDAAAVRAWDRWARDGERRRERPLTLLLAVEFPARLRALPPCGAEYLRTAFMAAVTILHEYVRLSVWL